MPLCVACGAEKAKADFAPSQLKKKANQRRCITCSSSQQQQQQQQSILAKSENSAPAAAEILSGGSDQPKRPEETRRPKPETVEEALDSHTRQRLEQRGRSPVLAKVSEPNLSRGEISPMDPETVEEALDMHARQRLEQRGRSPGSGLPRVKEATPALVSQQPPHASNLALLRPRLTSRPPLPPRSWPLCQGALPQAGDSGRGSRPAREGEARPA